MLDLGLQEFKKFKLPERIEGEKVILERRAHKHDEDLFRLIDGSRDFLREYLFWVDDTKTLDDVVKVTDIFSKNWDDENSFEYVFLDKENGKLVGAGGIHTVSYMNRMAEYGYYLDRTQKGKGYITEAVQLLEKELFERGIHRLVIECDENNRSSAAVAERCGFKFEGILRDAKFAYGGFRNEKIYAKLSSD